MKTFKITTLALIAVLLLVGSLALGQGANPSASVQQALIALDKQWGEAGGKGDTATLNKILSDNYLGIGEKGEALGKQEQVAATTATSAGVQNASYTADEYKFQALGPDVIVMTHRATLKGTQAGKEVTESHRSLHVFQKHGGQWQVVASTQLPIKE
ncbi:MAG: nuclear transport factor 2 family protein [Acidobacteriaceae bacterium]